MVVELAGGGGAAKMVRRRPQILATRLASRLSSAAFEDQPLLALYTGKMVLRSASSPSPRPAVIAAGYPQRAADLSRSCDCARVPTF